MDIKTVKLVCFSPTGTSRALVEAMARGIGHDDEELVDITRPEVRARGLETAADDLLVVAVPVYGGRVPLTVCDWLQTLAVGNTPTVCMVVYGNRDFDDALLELTDSVTERGGVPVAGAAFVAEHSFSSDELPVAVGRPDADDLERAEAFGREVGGRLQSVATVDELADLTVPGNRPYKERKPGGPLDFIAVSDECIQCGECAEVCPVRAIDPDRPMETDAAKCIRCCACIKVCPQGARSLKPSPIMDAAKWLNANCQARREPVVFF